MDNSFFHQNGPIRVPALMILGFPNEKISLFAAKKIELLDRSTNSFSEVFQIFYLSAVTDNKHCLPEAFFGHIVMLLM